MITTSEIKFPGFRENRDEYVQSQREWLELFNAALKPVHQVGWEEWQEDWLRDPFFEGTPIFSRINRRRKRGIVINQILPSDDDLSFRAYLDTFASDSDDRVEHVVITSTLTDKSKSKAQRLINAYLAHKLSSAEIEHLCEALTNGSVHADQE
jgi:hypothetical protein